MARTEHGGTRGRTGGGDRGRQALRREVPSTVALLADEDDFAAMRRYTSFGFEDHASYLRRMEALLRTLASQGVHTTVALFDPVAYGRFCADTGLDPDTPASRTRYTAEAAPASGTVTYEGQPLDHLLARLVGAVEQQATWEFATMLLARAGEPPARTDPGRAALDTATATLRSLLRAAGPGSHHLVCSVPVEGAPLVAVLHTDPPPDPPGGPDHAAAPSLDGAEALVFCTVLACGIATESPGGIVLRTTAPDGRDTVRGWALQRGLPRPLTEAEVFAAYCTDAETGDPIAPEHGVEYRAGLPLPPPGEAG